MPTVTDEDVRLFSRFEKISASPQRSKTTASSRSHTNAFHSTSLDEILRQGTTGTPATAGGSTIKSEAISHLPDLVSYCISVVYDHCHYLIPAILWTIMHMPPFGELSD